MIIHRVNLKKKTVVGTNFRSIKALKIDKQIDNN